MIAAQRTAETSEGFGRPRREELSGWRYLRRSFLHPRQPEALRRGRNSEEARKERRKREEGEFPLGMYEPHNGIVDTAMEFTPANPPGPPYMITSTSRQPPHRWKPRDFLIHRFSRHPQ